MTENRSPFRRHTSLLLMGLAGIFVWVQLFRLITNTQPTTANIALAFVMLFLATTATGGLVSWAIHRRMDREAPLLALIRQGAWAGTLLVLYAWLELLDILRWPIALMLLALFAAAEVLILLRGSR